MNKIFIVDFGSQTSHLISRRIRDFGIGVDIIDPELVLAEIDKGKPDGIIFSGGPASVYEKGAPTIDPKIFSLGIPILGICYGWQLTAHLLDGEVVSGHKEYGPAALEINGSSPLFSGLESRQQVWVSHGDTVVKLPVGFTALGRTQTVVYAAVADSLRNIYGVQFHPEVEHTTDGQKILKNFVEKICGLITGHHEISIEKIISDIKWQVGKGKVVCAVSGGVDSTVAAVLIGKAVGKNLFPVYVDSGLMRPGTREEIIDSFNKNVGIAPVVVEARQLFAEKLKGVTGGEDKRKIIGRLYIELFETEAKKIKNAGFLGQGTIYSDVIESKGTKHASKIKSHHNVGGLPEEMKLALVEPLRGFYKDEVRLIGKKLGLPENIVQKQPFPGPGNAIRIMGEVTPERLNQQNQADNILLEELEKAGWMQKIFQSFPVMTGAFSTAVKGDQRQLLEVVALRIYTSSDIMTTDWARLPYDLLQKISSRIVNEVPGVSRVVYDITTKPPATMEWE